MESIQATCLAQPDDAQQKQYPFCRTRRRTNFVHWCFFGLPAILSLLSCLQNPVSTNGPTGHVEQIFQTVFSRKRVVHPALKGILQHFWK